MGDSRVSLGITSFVGYRRLRNKVGLFILR